MEICMNFTPWASILLSMLKIPLSILIACDMFLLIAISISIFFKSSVDNQINIFKITSAISILLKSVDIQQYQYVLSI